jgi:hypothetical protein
MSPKSLANFVLSLALVAVCHVVAYGQRVRQTRDVINESFARVLK